MKPILSPDHITMLSAVINDIAYPLFDYKNDVNLNSNSRMRAVKNTVSYSFGHKSGSALCYDLKFSEHKEYPEYFKSVIKKNLENLNANFASRFGKEIPNTNIFLASKISLKVHRHPSGHYNLEYRLSESGLHSQFAGIFSGNMSSRQFYESSFRLYHFLMLAGYDVDFTNIIKLEHLNSVMVELDLDTRIKLRGWIHRHYTKDQDEIIRNLVDKKIEVNFKNMGLVYQANLFGDYGKTFMPFSLYAEGILVPEIYFTEESLHGKKLQPYR
ncbi:hypothetical protein [Klebsiella sp. BIGb0407]|uniref:hypothetical protein n=1 Tax=Klebsiella sp. BIGb0407 TaxID=2940603 RepID=UPI002166F20B|nr:hypothetical protein [Klebsiella sp. BIGb0407]MCS3430582.1 hypothetical protein [Klebsiella sp. BIGb0407]